MRRRPALVWLLLAGMLAGQWLLAAHDTQHWQNSKAHLCQLCLHHPAQDAIAGSAAPLWSTAPVSFVPPPAEPVAAKARPFWYYRSRGPPQALA